MSGEGSETNWPSPQQAKQVLGRNARRRKAKENAVAESNAASNQAQKAERPEKGIVQMKLPNEIILMICDNLDAEDLMMFAQAWSKVGQIMTEYDVIRTRELQCFCFKKDYMSANLGIGVKISERGKIGSLESEFDLLSYEGFINHGIRRSVQGVHFDHWLALPISNGHWRKVRPEINISLTRIGTFARMENFKPVQVIFNFMNDVVVKLNDQASKETYKSPYYPYEESAKSTLTHASEKAIESYFHLFHLLLCLATEDPSIVQEANNMLLSFSRGENSKTTCPNLGHLLVAALISSVPMSDALLKAIIKETVTRNVVWMLDSKGANMPELSYLEPSSFSEYRLQKTFNASKTSYRLLMFLNLFRRTAVGSPPKPLQQLRDEAFERHGAPPRGSAKGLANMIKKIHLVKNFPEFLLAIGIAKPSKEWFTNFLRECIKSSEAKGYHRNPLSQGRALWLRQQEEPNVEVAEGVVATHVWSMSGVTFFPGRGSADGSATRGGRRGRGRGGYRGRGGR